MILQSNENDYSSYFPHLSTLEYDDDNMSKLVEYVLNILCIIIIKHPMISIGDSHVIMGVIIIVI